jgi:hypothetical protein
MTSTATGRIYISLSNIYDAQHHPLLITPPIYCKVTRFSRINNTPTQPFIRREFDVVIDMYGLQNGIILSLSSLPEYDPRYGLMIKGQDAQGFSFICKRSIMLTQCGQINGNLPTDQKTFYMILDSNLRTPTDEVQNNALYHFPNVGGD